MDQVDICDYKSDDDFIIKLRTKAADDQLILAKIPPGPSLKRTIAIALARAGKAPEQPWHPGYDDLLAIPKLNFDLEREFSELEGLVLSPSAAAHLHPNPPLYVKKAEQLIRFQLNEKGALLKSEAVMELAAAGASEGVPEPTIMIFDKPFLILMKRAKSSQPYFALWVGNASLLVPVGHDRSVSLLNSKYADIYCARGYACETNGIIFGSRDQGYATSNGKAALESFTKALQIDPDCGKAYNGIAWLSATYPADKLRDGKKAVENANKACDLSRWQDPNFVDTLACAYAETGDFENAVKWEKKCREYPGLPQDVADGAAKHLALFQDHKPFRDSR